jgi:hypothetical protein
MHCERDSTCKWPLQESCDPPLLQPHALLLLLHRAALQGATPPPARRQHARLAQCAAPANAPAITRAMAAAAAAAAAAVPVLGTSTSTSGSAADSPTGSVPNPRRPACRDAGIGRACGGRCVCLAHALADAWRIHESRYRSSRCRRNPVLGPGSTLGWYWYWMRCLCCPCRFRRKGHCTLPACRCLAFWRPCRCCRWLGVASARPPPFFVCCCCCCRRRWCGRRSRRRRVCRAAALHITRCLLQPCGGHSSVPVAGHPVSVLLLRRRCHPAGP